MPNKPAGLKGVVELANAAVNFCPVVWSEDKRAREAMVAESFVGSVDHFSGDLRPFGENRNNHDRNSVRRGFDGATQKVCETNSSTDQEEALDQDARFSEENCPEGQQKRWCPQRWADGYNRPARSR